MECSISKYIKSLALLVSSPAVANKGCCGCRAASIRNVLAKLKPLCIFVSLEAWSQKPSLPTWASTAVLTLLPPVPCQSLPSCADARGWEPSSPDVDVLW